MSFTYLKFAIVTFASMTSSSPINTPVEYFRLDYKPLPYKVPEIFLDFKLGLSESIVTTKSKIQRVSSEVEDLFLNGEDTLELLDIKIGDKKVLDI